MRETLAVETEQREELRDITPAVQERLPDMDNGLCHLFVQHTTAGLTINEAETNLMGDMEAFLESLAPQGDGYDHDRIDNNADAHLRSMLLGSSVSVPIVGGDLDLGTWQQILFFEGDGPRTRTVVMMVHSDRGPAKGV